MALLCLIESGMSKPCHSSIVALALLSCRSRGCDASDTRHVYQVCAFKTWIWMTQQLVGSKSSHGYGDMREIASIPNSIEDLRRDRAEQGSKTSWRAITWWFATVNFGRRSSGTIIHNKRSRDDPMNRVANRHYYYDTDSGFSKAEVRTKHWSDPPGTRFSFK